MSRRKPWNFLIAFLLTFLFALIGNKTGLFDAPILILLGGALVVGILWGLLTGFAGRYYRRRALKRQTTP